MYMITCSSNQTAKEERASLPLLPVEILQALQNFLKLIGVLDQINQSIREVLAALLTSPYILYNI